MDIGLRYLVILPKNDHISLLLVRHYHAQVKHQGRDLTEGTVRAAGFWLLGGKRLINSVLHKCVTCRRLRGKMQEQCMADFPQERLKSCPLLHTWGWMSLDPGLSPPGVPGVDKLEVSGGLYCSAEFQGCSH